MKQGANGVYRLRKNWVALSAVTNGTTPHNGKLPLPPGPGLGVELDPAVLKRPDVTLKRMV